MKTHLKLKPIPPPLLEGFLYGEKKVLIFRRFVYNTHVFKVDR